MALALLALCIAGALSSPEFFTLSNGLNIAQQVSIIGIMAVGMTFVIIAADIDLSVGSIYALSSVTSAQVLAQGQSMTLAIAVGLGAGALAGLLNGILVVGFKIPSFIVTLGTLSMFRGISLLLTEGSPISLNESMANVAQFAVIGQGKLFEQVPVQVLIFLAVIVAGVILLTRSRFGFHVYAVGGSPTASRLAGINVSLIRVLNFVISGTLAGLAGLIGLSFLLYVQGVSGSGLELTVITAVIVGGTALFGGSGSIIGTVIGVLIIGVLNNVLVLHGVSSFWQTTVIGVVIIAAVAFDAFVRRRAA
ncbi:ABC transporter permease [Pseudoclavibacter terrae]|uniref:ABC transporter permease n=1 Tax=Pseudoclavibacter terrae TaxID=1530195 RepID=UPI00232D48DC|nr:ABC transporter permease [Pseudoclavibacter terrae]